MKKPHIFTDLSDPELIDVIRAGGVGVLPTDTVYGLVCAASNQTAVEKLYALKSRENKPGTVIAADIDQLVRLGLKARYLKAVEHFWPAPISVVIPSYELSYLHLGKGSLAVRIPKNATLLQLLRGSGPLLTTSANLPGRPEAHTSEQARQYFGDKLDFYVEGGDLSGRQPSTVIRIVDDAIEVLREGAVKIDEVTGKIL